MSRRTTHPAGRGRAAAAGLAIVATYVVLAAVSGRLSPLARGPLLDGLGPGQAYRWVSPPPDLAPTNIAPSGLTMTLPLTAKGVQGKAETSDDGQLTLIVGEGTVGPREGDTSVRFKATPVDPGRLGPLGDGLEAFGNAYRIGATYLPSRTRVPSLVKPLDVVLVYPVTVTLHTTKHQIVSSPDGKRWKTREGTDSPALQQVEALVPRPGYVVVGGVPGPAPVSNSPLGSEKEANTLAIVLMVASGCMLLVGIGFVLRGRRP